MDIHELWDSADKCGWKQPSLTSHLDRTVVHPHHFGVERNLTHSSPMHRPRSGHRVDCLASQAFRPTRAHTHTTLANHPFITHFALCSRPESSSTKARERIRVSSWYTAGRVVMTVEWVGWMGWRWRWGRCSMGRGGGGQVGGGVWNSTSGNNGHGWWF